ncbi:tetratricopeptide repeat protein [Streptomyces sp. enrichment culture]|uniref:tetratricopeptide repeat protein n=1 Tax=Streptomyces sp. enrichment culture TaxID=1795815 RepID=UPI003F565CF7
MKTERVSQVVLLAGAGAVLAGALALLAADGPVGAGGTGAGAGGAGAAGAPGVPAGLAGPAARAAAGMGAGAGASPPDLAALIGDREAWLRRHPGDAVSWAVLGAAYTEHGVRTGDPAAYPKAERALRRSLEARPAGGGGVLEARPAGGGGAPAVLGLGELAQARGDFGTALRWARKAGSGWRAQALLVDAHRGLGDDAAAGEALERLRKLRPTSGAAQARAVELYRDRGWREDAAARAHDAVALSGTSAERAAALRRLGDLEWERGYAREALARYEAALRVAPGDAPSMAGRARALAALGRTDEALRMYGAALEARPLPEYALEAGDLYAALGRDAAARERYARAVELADAAESYGVDTALVRGRYEAEHGDPERAVEVLRARWRGGHRSAEVADALGWALLRAGEPEQALPYARAATGRGVRSALFAYHRGEVERALGRDGAARRALEEALRINPYFSPLHAPAARRALAELGEPPQAPPER